MYKYLHIKTILLILLTMQILNIFSQTKHNVPEAKGLNIGTKAPMFSAIDANSSTFVLADALKDGPVVIIFYRGHWCPVCNKHLSQIQDSLNLIMNKGARVVAISAQKPEYLTKMENKTEAKFSLLYDEGFKISAAYDATFKPDAMTIATYNTVLNAKLKKSQTDDSQRLPIPATYIISKQGVIVWRQFDPNYKSRSSVNDIISNLP